MSSSFDVEDSPRRRRPEPEIARPWLITFTAVLLACTLANLLTVVILYYGVRAYVNYKAREFIEELKKQDLPRAKP